MMKKLLSLLLLVPAIVCCNPAEQKEGAEPDFSGPDYEKAAPQLKNGDTVLANSQLSEDFLTTVTYSDWRDETSHKTKVYDYYGGFRGKDLNWDNWEKDWPNGDKPNAYSIRWEKDATVGSMTLKLSDKLGWSAETAIKEASCYVDITNLVPNDEYEYEVVSETGKVMAKGSFKTKGSVHQVFFKNKCRNARDLGGWKTADGKTVKYRKIYRGGRMNDPWETMLNKAGKQEVLDEGIGAELELRGSDDYMTTPAVKELDHCHPCIEEGGKVMLGVTKPSAKNCARWLVYDETSPWTAEQKAPYLTSEGRIDKDKIGEITPTSDEYAAFQTAYKAKTKDCFMFVYNSVKAGKGVYFHCSLGRDRTGTMSILLMGLLGVPEKDIAREYELTYFAPVGFSVSSSDKASNPEPIFKNTREHWVYSDVVPYFWSMAGEGSFASGVEKYLVQEAGVSQAVIDDFRSLMLE